MAETEGRSRGGRADRAKPAEEPQAAQGDGEHAGDQGGRSEEQVKAERRGVQPKRASGPGSGNRLLIRTSDGDTEATTPGDLYDADVGQVMVVVKHDVVEEVPAPGAPNRTIKKLRFRAGRAIPKATLDAHFRERDRQRKAAEGGTDPESSK